MNELEQANQAISIQNDDDDDYLLNNTFDNFFSSHILNNNAGTTSIASLSSAKAASVDIINETLSPEDSPVVTPKSPKNKKKRYCKEKDKIQNKQIDFYVFFIRTN